MKKLLVILLSALLCFNITACEEDKKSKRDDDDESLTENVSDNNNSESNSSKGPNEDVSDVSGNEDSEDSKNESVVKKELLSKSDISMYSEIQDTNYISAVLYEGNPEKEGLYSKSIVAVNDIKQTLYNTEMLSDEFVCTVSNNFLYHYSLTSDYAAYKSLCKYGSTFDQRVYVDLFKGYNGDLYETKGTIRTNLDESDPDITSDEYRLVTENFKVSWLHGETEISSVFIKIAEIGTIYPQYVHVLMQLRENIPIDENMETAINEAIQNNAFLNTVYILSDINDPNSVERVIGPDVGLEKTTSIQDILARKFSNAYGLNLKDRTVKIFWDSTYIEFAKDGKNIIFDWFENCYADYKYNLEYDHVKETAEKDGKKMFSYTDSSGAKYEYIYHSYTGICIYKNQKLVNIAHSDTDSQFEALSYFFGIK